jgi:two-component system LytT family response regulator
MRILACDDEPLALVRISDMVREVAEADLVEAVLDSRQALERIAHWHPDLVLLDVEMPGLDGFDVIERTDFNDAVAPPLVLFMTAHPALARHDTSGAVAWLGKPVRRARLMEALDVARGMCTSRDRVDRMIRLQGQVDSLRESRALLDH